MVELLVAQKKRWGWGWGRRKEGRASPSKRETSADVHKTLMAFRLQGL